MIETRNKAKERREFLKRTGQAAAASAMAGTAMSHVHAAESNTIQVALIGCGSRGAGAAANALSNKSGPIKLVAMADVFGARLSASYGHLTNRFAAQVDVPDDRRFVGLDAYQQAMNCLRSGDLVILATPPGFRWVHFRYALDKALNVFMEKPVAVDGPTGCRMIALAEEAEKKNLKVGVGLMLRHCRARRALWERIRSGEIGEIVSMRSTTLLGPNNWRLGIKFLSPAGTVQKSPTTANCSSRSSGS